MNYFDILLAKKLSGGSPTPPGDTYERKSVTSYPVTDAANYPLPKVDVTVTDADKCEVIVTTDNTITEDSGVYIERQSGGGNRELDAIVGGSIVWNQLFSSTASGTVNGIIKAFNSTTGLIELSGEATTSYAELFGKISPIQGHKYAILISVKENPNNIDFRIGSLNTNVNNLISAGSTVVSAVNSYNNSGIGVQSYSVGTDFTGIKLKFAIVDLTATFGSTIADYIYTLEQATAGSGIAWLRSYGYLTEDYYGYTANKIESVSVARHVMKDSNDSVIGSYAINPITLRGVPKLNASNQLYYDGDRYEASGRVTRKYGVVDMGTLNWYITSSTSAEGGAVFAIGINNVGEGMAPRQRYTNNTALSSGYTTASSATWWVNDIHDFNISSSETTLYIADSRYLDATAFKTAVSGVMLIYEKATPTYEDSSPFEANQIVDANGTEQYIDAGVEAGTRDVAIPVGHETKYYHGKAYVKPLTAGTSDTVSMADLGIMPTSPMYISANGEIDAEYWKQTE